MVFHLPIFRFYLCDSIDNVPRGTNEHFFMICPVCNEQSFVKKMSVIDHFFTKEPFQLIKCLGCGMIITDPHPLPEEIGRYYQTDKYLSHTSSKRDLLSAIYRLARSYSLKLKYNHVKKYMAGNNILDIGCGSGEFLSYCSMKGLSVWGVEPNANARMAANANGITRIVDDFMQIERVDSGFDCITLWHVLEHIYDQGRTLERISSLLNDNGILVIALPNLMSWDARAFKSFWAGYDVPRHLYHYTRKTFPALAENCNFELLNIIPQKLDAYFVSMLSLKYKYGFALSILFPLFGLYSNLRAKYGNDEYSSLIYILKKKMP